jgi:hypothetical protein
MKRNYKGLKTLGVTTGLSEVGLLQQRSFKLPVSSLRMNVAA